MRRWSNGEVLLATWNVNGLRARMDFVMHWLRARQPDVVGLQELKLTDDQFPLALFEAAGYHVVTHGQKAWNGVAILSRSKATVTQRGLPGQDAFGARLITADIEDLSFTTVYTPNGKSVEHEDYPKKLAWVEALTEYSKGYLTGDGKRSILCGDFNICPAAIDSWNEAKLGGKIFHTEEERSRFQQLLDAGWVDVFRDLYPEDQKFSWWDYRGGAFHRKQGLRIDLILATPALRERSKQVTIDREYRKKQDGLTASDHAPVIIELD